MTAFLTPPWIAILVAGISAFLAIKTYLANTNTKRAEFLMELHKSFFVEETYDHIRELLDNSSHASRDRLHHEVAAETEELTGFLNFFELIAYFEVCKTLRHKDVRALLGYYLDLLKAEPVLSHYIGKDDKSFENLKKLLNLKLSN
jgi:hypothetical protein